MRKSRISTKQRPSFLPAKKTTTKNSQPKMQTNSQPSIQRGSGIGDSMKQGFGLGLGLEAARAAVGTAAGVFTSSEKHESTSEKDEFQNNKNLQKCEFEQSVWKKCHQENNPNINCDDFYQLWEKCRMNNELNSYN